MKIADIVSIVELCNRNAEPGKSRKLRKIPTDLLIDFNHHSLLWYTTAQDELLRRQIAAAEQMEKLHGQ